MKKTFNLVIISFLAFNAFSQSTKIINSPNGAVISNIGGTDIPYSASILDIRSTTQGLLIPRMTSIQRALIGSPVKGLQVFDTNTNTFWFYDGTDWVEWRPSQWKNLNSSVSIMNTNIGIGISSPSEKLHVIGNIRNTGRIDADGVIEAAGLSSTGALYINSTSLLQGAVTGSSTGLFYGKLTSNTGMEINDAAGLLNFRASSNDKGFLQLSGDNLRIGTYSSNNLGKFVVRTQGYDQIEVDGAGGDSKMYFNYQGANVASISPNASGHLYIDTSTPNSFVSINSELYVNADQNKVGIGTTTPAEKLEVNGNLKVNGSITLSGEVTKSSGGVGNFLPLCFGKVGFGGEPLYGSENFGSTNPSTGHYTISHPSIDYQSTIIVTLNSSNAQIIASAGCSTGECSVYLKDGFSNNNAFAPIDQAFYFVIYR